MVTLIGKRQAKPFFNLELSTIISGPQLKTKPHDWWFTIQAKTNPLCATVHCISFLHSNSCESLSQDIIRAKMGCFLGELYMLIHTGRFSLTKEYEYEYSNKGVICGSPLLSFLQYHTIHALIAVVMYTFGTMLSSLSPMAFYTSQYWWCNSLAGVCRGSKAGQK